jgi:hypothetical protein
MLALDKKESLERDINLQMRDMLGEGLPNPDGGEIQSVVELFAQGEDTSD